MSADPADTRGPEAGTTRPTAAERLRDLVALLLLVGGVGLFFYARANLQELAGGTIVRVPGHSAVEQFVYWDRLSRVGLWTAGAGLALAVLFFLVRRRRLASPPAQP